MRGVVLVAFLLAVPLAFGHVGYVVDQEEFAASAGPDVPYLLQALTEPVDLALILATLLIVPVAVLGLRRLGWFLNLLTHIRKVDKEYEQFLPWIMRLSLGMALIGAGSAHVYVSPLLSATTIIASLEIVLGFLLLAGLLTGPVTIISLALFVVGIGMEPYLLGNLDFFALGLALVALGSSRPGIDDLLGWRFLFSFPHLKRYVPTILRCGIGLAMVYLAVYEKFLNPHISQLVVENYHLQAGVPVSASMWVLSAGLIELAVGLALLLGICTRTMSTIAFIVLSVSFFTFNEEVFSHITLFGTLSALFVTGGGPLSFDAVLEKARAKRRRGRAER